MESRETRASQARSGRARAEAELRHSEEMFRLLVASVSEYAIFLLDPEGHIITWNLGAQRLKGYSAKEIIGQHFSVFYPPEIPRDRIARELVIAVDEGQFREEGWRVRKDGSRFWADVTITPVRDDQGQLRGFAKVTRDMTHRKLAEEQRNQLVRAEAARTEAERANRMKDEFLATLSHELRTPLNAILGWATLLETHSLDRATTERAISVIRRNAVAQTQLISDILDISRISTGRVHLTIESVELHRVVLAALDVVGPAAAAKDIRLNAVKATEGTVVSGDADRLQQVVWNLLSNAVKFTPRGGHVDVDLRRVDSHVRLTIADSGSGIEPEFLPHAFEAFRQADSSATRRHGGLGLGLAIVRRLVELHGGTVSAESPGVGQGATFVIDLPVPAVKPKAAAGSAMPSASGEPERDPAWAAAPSLHGLVVLVVEDDPDSREVLQTSLESLGAQVTLTSTAQEAMDFLRERRPDVVVSDIEMPDESGYDLVQRIRDLPPSQGGLVPAIALTAYARTEDRIRALAAGFQTHIAKPVHPVELAAAIAALTARTR